MDEEMRIRMSIDGIGAKLSFISSLLLLHALQFSLSLSVSLSHFTEMTLPLTRPVIHSYIPFFLSSLFSLNKFHYVISDHSQLHPSYQSLALISFYTSSLLLSPLPLHITSDHLYPWLLHWVPDQERATHTWTEAISMGDRTVRYRISSVQ